MSEMSLINPDSPSASQLNIRGVARNHKHEYFSRQNAGNGNSPVDITPLASGSRLQTRSKGSLPETRGGAGVAWRQCWR